MYRKSLLVALLSFCTASFATPELQHNASERTQCKFQDQTDVTVEYDGMRMNGRKIFGGVAPYGKLWEMGDKRSPTFVTSANLVVGGKTVPPGNYTLFTMPNPDKWTMIIKKMTSKSNPNAIGEVARIDMMVRRLPSPVESFTISFEQWRSGCVLNLRWEETEASVLLAENK